MVEGVAARRKKGRGGIAAQRGATMLELSLIVALLLAMLSGVIWIELTINARTSLTLALGQALRFGVTRSLPDPYTGINDAAGQIVDEAHAGAFTGSNERTLIKLLYHGADSTVDEDTVSLAAVIANYVDPVNLAPVFDSFGGGIIALPKSYLYTLISVHQFMRTRVGKHHLRYPCVDQPGCLACQFLNPGIAADGSAATNSGLEGEWDPTQEIPPRRIVLRCTYLPDFGFYRLAQKFFGAGAAAPFRIRRTLSVWAREDL